MQAHSPTISFLHCCVNGNKIILAPMESIENL